MFLTIIKSDNQIDKVEVNGESKYVTFEIIKPEELKRKVLNQLLEDAGYQLILKEMYEPLKKEMESLKNNTDEESLKRMGEIIKEISE